MPKIEQVDHRDVGAKVNRDFNRFPEATHCQPEVVPDLEHALNPNIIVLANRLHEFRFQRIRMCMQLQFELIDDDQQRIAVLQFAGGTNRGELFRKSANQLFRTTTADRFL